MDDKWGGGVGRASDDANPWTAYLCLDVVQQDSGCCNHHLKIAISLWGLSGINRHRIFDGEVHKVQGKL